MSSDSIAAFTSPPEKPVLFLVNPKSGPGRAEKIFRQSVEPLLKAAHPENESYIVFLFELQEA